MSDILQYNLPQSFQYFFRPLILIPQTIKIAHFLVFSQHFQWNDKIADPQGFSEELADVALYLLQLASVTGIDLEDAIMQKLKKNYHRQWDNAENEGKQ